MDGEGGDPVSRVAEETVNGAFSQKGAFCLAVSNGES